MSKGVMPGRKEREVRFNLAGRQRMRTSRIHVFPRFLSFFAMPVLICLWLGSWLACSIGEKGEQSSQIE